jgi:hypothetical protein
MWLNLEVSEYYAQKETIMWENMAKYVEKGNDYISMLHDTRWFRGWEGLPEGCTLKPVTAAAFNSCVKLEASDVKQIFIYLDGSSATHDSEPVMSWGFCCFKIDKELNHELFFSSGGIMCSDEDSHLYFGAERHNSFTAELQANVMARLWLLQSGVAESIKIVFLYDNQSAADAIVGKSVSRTNCIMCKFGLAVDRLCNKMYASISHHIHSHDQHPWNELADSICTFVVRKPQESRVRWTPISPLSKEKAFCIDIASCVQYQFFADSVSKDVDIPMTCQIALNSKHLAEK